MPLTNLEPTDLFTAVETKIDAAIDKVNEIDADLTGGTTDQVLKKTDATDYNYEWANSILPLTGTANLKIKIMNIGDWNLDSTASVLVAHGIADYTKIRSVSVVVRDDTDSVYSISPYLDPSVLLFHRLETTNIFIQRTGSSFFDSTNYNSTSFNRGHITIIYEG